MILPLMICKYSYFEGKMLEEVCGAIGLVCLCSTPSINPYTNGRGLRPRRVFGSNLARLSASNSMRIIEYSRSDHWTE